MAARGGEGPAAGWRAWVRRLWPVAFWVAVWQLAALAVGQRILLASPADTLAALADLARTADFWLSIATSLARIFAGFAAAVVCGTALAALAARFRPLRDLLAPFVQVVKAVPVASFVILVLIWVPSENLSVIIAFLMVFPIVYTNMLEGIAQTDAALLEMADVFRIGPVRRIRYIYRSQALPYFQAACSLALGLCWKAGIAAEVIGLPDRSIGEHLYEAKLYLATPDLFAWTLTIVLISLVFEKAFGALVRVAVAQIEAAP